MRRRLWPITAATGIVVVASLALTVPPSAHAVENGRAVDGVLDGNWGTNQAQIYRETPNGDAYACTGTVIDSRKILTAAHCFDVGDRWVVRTGSVIRGEGDRRGIKNIEKHFDLTVIETYTNINTYGAPSVAAYERAQKGTDLPLKARFRSMGWGRGCQTCPPTAELREIQVSVMDTDPLFKDAKGGPAFITRGVGNSRLHTGDSGGPVMSVDTFPDNNSGAVQFIYGVNSRVESGPGFGKRQYHSEINADANLAWLKEQGLAVMAIPSHPTLIIRAMPLGDSITAGRGSGNGAGYRDDLHTTVSTAHTLRKRSVDFVGSQKSGGGPDADHEGHSGWRIDQIDKRLDCALPYYRPNLVMLHLGTNDMNQNFQVASAPARLGAVIDEIFTRAPEVTLLVSTLVPSTKPDVGPRIQQFNGQIRTLVEQRRQAGRHVQLIDMGSVTTPDLADQLHPNDAGYRKMAEAWADGVEDAAVSGWIKTPASGGGEPCGVEGPDSGGPDGGGNGDGSEGGGGWQNQGRIASGVADRTPGDKVRFHDMNGDDRADYLVVSDNGSIDGWQNNRANPGGPAWLDQGEIAPGTGAPGGDVRLADINGDRRDDYLVVAANGAVRAWLNTPGNGGKPSWSSQGEIAPGVGAPREEIAFADINGDHRDDYLTVTADGAIRAWLNTPGNGGRPSWSSQGLFAAGVNGGSRSRLQLVDIDGDAKADYLQVAPDGAVHAWLNKGGEGRGGWVNRGLFAKGVGEAAGNRVRFADISADRKADYLVVNSQGAVNAWLNGGGD